MTGTNVVQYLSNNDFGRSYAAKRTNVSTGERAQKHARWHETRRTKQEGETCQTI